MILELTSANVEAVAGAVVDVLRLPGAVLLLPTETVYGLVCRANDPAAVEQIYRLKARDARKVLGWFIGDWRKLEQYGVRLGGLPERLAQKYCPGPITIIAPRDPEGTVGFRIPDHPLLLAVLSKIDFPLAQTSANLSGRPNAATVQQALAELTGEVALAVDAGAIPAGAAASTVVDATGAEPVILRQGALEVSI